MDSGLKQSLVLAIVTVVAMGAASAGPLRERLAEHRSGQQQQLLPGGDLHDDGSAGAMARVPEGVKVLRDVAYGQDPRQRFDVYLPSQARNAPVIFMVHGGGWRRGDKAMATVIENKVARWVPRGFIVISTNYRMLPDTKPIEQARDVGHALGTAQQKAAEWGGDPGKFILMGHSAGAHLVALLAVSPGMAALEGARPWLGTIPLDSGGYDVVQVMEGRHFSLYDDAFGNNPEYWRRASPYYQINQAAQPILAVCSSRRAVACPQAHAFVTRAKTFGTQATVLEKAMTHKEINDRLGADPAYTAEVESFMRQLDPAVAAALASRAP
jgi:arylformamidase